MLLNVVWLNFNTDAPNRGYWDQSLLAKTLEHAINRDSVDAVPEGEGAVIVIPGQQNKDHVKRINAAIKQLPWCLIIVTGDEAGIFPIKELEHPKSLLYLMTPHLDQDLAAVDRFIPEGYTPDTHVMIAKYEHEYLLKPLGWSFAGQVTHQRRVEASNAMRMMRNGLIFPTTEFASGLGHEEYYRIMASTKVIPCPSGPTTPDTFRLFEALEAGCVPIADTMTPGASEPSHYWNVVLGAHPIPTIDDWSTLPDTVQYHIDVFPETNNRVFAWWQGFKRNFFWNIIEDVNQLSGINYAAKENITVLVPTSPVPSNPSVDIIEETIASIRHHLPTAEIIIMIDGVRDEQQERKPAYQEYVRRLLWKCNFQWEHVVPMLFATHHHQAAMTREALKAVKTPLILFVEHDTPLTPDHDIDFDGISNVILSKQADMVRFHFEAFIPEEHKYLMLDEVPKMVDGVPMVRTAQWSQRPHVASVEFYKRILENHFSADSRTMIEDRMHGVVVGAFNERRTAGWNEFKIWIYHPEGDIKRSYHLDGRQTDPKYDMKF